MTFMSFSEWAKLRASNGKPSGPRGMTKCAHKEKKSSGTREHEKDDLSSDYKGHICHNGEVAPFSIAKKTKSTAAADVGK